MRAYGWVILLTMGAFLQGQTHWRDFRPTYPAGGLPSAERPRLRDPSPFQAEWHPSPTAQNLYEKVLTAFRTATTLPGYRIQILTTERRAEADSVRFFVMENFPELSVYRLYETPVYKIRVGDFLDKREAEQWVSRLYLYFPGAFVVPDKILRR